ncbi:MAG: hypothetical protein WCI03_01515 [bacterium]
MFNNQDAIHVRGGLQARILGLCLLACLILSSGVPVSGAVITLKIRAINPSQSEKQKAIATALLPSLVKPENVENTQGFEFVYDVAGKTYRINKEVELNPAETRTFEVVIKDVWVIPEDEIQKLALHAGKLAGALKSSDKEETAGRLQGVIDEGVKAVISRQAAYAVGAVKPLDHIRAYEANLDAMSRIRKDVGVLENLVISAGKDPEMILGAPKSSPAVDRDINDSTNAVVILHIKVTNTSPTEKRPIPVRHEFPAEVRATDIIDAGGLEIGVDATKNVCYAYLAEALELEPKGERVFDVKIKDPWALPTGKLARLETRIKEILNITREMETYQAVNVQAQAILKDLEEVKERKGPDVVNDQYVAFARQQVADVQGVEGRIRRLEELFQPSEKTIKSGVPMMDVPRPDKRTTWVIIYIILGFLGVFSLLFFLRWFGKGKAEKIDGAGG